MNETAEFYGPYGAIARIVKIEQGIDIIDEYNKFFLHENRIESFIAALRQLYPEHFPQPDREHDGLIAALGSRIETLEDTVDTLIKQGDEAEAFSEGIAERVDGVRKDFVNDFNLVSGTTERYRDEFVGVVNGIMARLDKAEAALENLWALATATSEAVNPQPCPEFEELTFEPDERIDRIEEKIDYLGSRTFNDFAEKFSIDPDRVPRRVGRGN